MKTINLTSFNTYYISVVHVYHQNTGSTFWDFTDRDTWINGFFNIKDWPTIYDESLKPKPAYFGVLEGLKETL